MPRISYSAHGNGFSATNSSQSEAKFAYTLSGQRQLNCDLKLGQFRFEESDHVLETMGLPLSITRVYDSSKLTDGDFGVGWSFAVHDVDLEFNEDRALLKALDSDETVDARVGGGRDATLTLPDGRRTTFRFRFESMPSLNFGHAAVWDPEPGVTATLSTPNPGAGEQPGENTVFALPAGLVYWHYGGVQTPIEHYDIPRLDLTLQDGTKYEIRREDLGGHYTQTRPERPFYTHAYGKARVSRIERPNKESLVITANGIDHVLPNGQVTRSLFFQRGLANRIVAVRDESAQSPSAAPLIEYEYDAKGNLLRVHKLIDRAEGTRATTTYVYGNAAFPHYITEVRDPRGVPLARNTYYPSGDPNAGKLQKVKTPDDHERSFAYESGAGFTPGITGSVARQTVTDQDSNATIHETDARGNILLTIDAKQNHIEREFDDRNNLTKQTIKPATGSGLTTEFVPDYAPNDPVWSKNSSNGKESVSG